MLSIIGIILSFSLFVFGIYIIYDLSAHWRYKINCRNSEDMFWFVLDLYVGAMCIFTGLRFGFLMIGY